MIIISDCLTEQADEGSLKVANSLTRRIKSMDPQTKVISYGRSSQFVDINLKLNKLFLNRSLFSEIRNADTPVLYIPFSSNTLGSALRITVLSRLCRNLKAVFVLRHRMSAVTRWLLRRSGVQIIVLSQDSYDFYRRDLHNVVYVKTGVNTQQFHPVSAEEKLHLRRKYGFREDSKMVLHVGHCNPGRNVQSLLKVDEKMQVCLVISSVTRKNTDAQLERSFRTGRNTCLMDTFQEHIEELYQLADVYVFPVQQMESCIDVPLSVLEAAACNIPVVTSDYGELKNFRGRQGFCFLEDFSEESLNEALELACSGAVGGGRDTVLEYDWSHAVREIMQL